MRLNHIRRVISGFVIVVAAYWAYTVIAVPWIEPQVRRKTSRADARTQAPSTNRYRAELSRLFTPGSWELDNPKVLKSEQATLLLQEYRTLPNGRLELKPCTVVFYLSKGEREDTRRRTLILQAPEGAVLAFDGPLNLRQANMGSRIRPIGGQLVGPVRIRSTGLQRSSSDLQIDTSNVQITQQRILTREAVTFQMGPNRGSGRDLMLTLSEQATEGNVKDRLLGGLKIVELQHLESLQLLLEGDVFSSDDAQPVTPLGTPAPPVPVEVTCDGPLRIDLQGMIATLEQGVRLQRLNHGTAPDRLECERLSLHFSKSGESPPEGADTTQASQDRDEPIAIKRVVASGNPVTINAPSRGARFKGQRLEYDLETRRIQMKGIRPLDPRDETRQPAVFQDTEHFIAAPSVEYVAGTNGRIGRLFASGPGQYRGSPSPGEVPAFEAEWQQQISLRPVQGEHELALDGGVRVASEQWGRMAAETVKVTLSEVAKSQTHLGDHTPSPNFFVGPSQLRTTLEPRQFVAVAPTNGFIDFDSPQMSGRLQKLTVSLRPEHLVSAPAAATSPGMMRFPLDDRGTASPKPNAHSKYHIQGGEVTAWLDRGRTIEVRFVQIDRDAHLVQTQGVIPGRQPLEISGDFVQIKNPADGQGRVLIKGLPAIVKASELELRGHAIRLDAGANRLWIDGAGTMHLPMPQGVQGNRLPTGGRLQISWRGGMDFDGETIKYSDDVIVASPQQQMRTEELHARLDRYVSFAQPPEEMRDVHLLTLWADSDVLLTNHTVDPSKGLLSVDRLSVRDLNINQQSGEILAHGPGWIARTFPRGSISLPGAKPTGNSSAKLPVAGAWPPQLSYLKVVFQDRMDGNFHRRDVRLRDQVEAIYGPVSSWDEQLELRASLRPDDTRLSCDELAVTQFGPTRLQQSLELLARGNTFVETQTYAARGHQIKYTQGKNMLILEGNARQAAELFRRGRVGGPVMRHAAQRILYWPSLQQVEIDGGKYLDVSNLPSSPDVRR